MTFWEQLLAGAALAAIITLPVVLLILLRRRLGQWWAAGALTIALGLPAFGVSTSVIVYGMAYHRVVVRGDTSVPDSIPMAVADYLGYVAALCGAFATLIAAVGFGVSLVPLVGWRLVHTRSFERVTSRSPRGHTA